VGLEENQVIPVLPADRYEHVGELFVALDVRVGCSPALWGVFPVSVNPHDLAERLTTVLREEVAKAGLRSTMSDAPSFEVHPATGIIQEEEVEEAEFRSELDRLGPLPTVLIVEDDPSTREYLRAALEAEGCEVLEAAYQLGVEAMALSPSPIKAVLLDGNVPFADGQMPTATLPLALRLQAAGIPVIIHSGDDKINEDAREHGLRVVPKGSSLSDLLRAVQSCVEGAPEG